MKARLSADMLMAARRGDWKKLQKLVQQRADVNACASHKISPLMLAARKLEPEVCDMLLAHRAAVDARDSLPNKQSALMYASVVDGRKTLEVLQVLMRNDASVDLQDSLGRTSLMLAAEVGHLAVIRFLSEHSADVNLKAQTTDLNERAMGFPRKAVRRFLENSSGQPTNAIDTYMRAQRRLAKETEEAAREELAKLDNEMTYMISEPVGTSEVIDEYITESGRVETLSEEFIDDDERDSEYDSEDDAYEDDFTGFLPNGMFLSKVAPLRPKDLAKETLPLETQKTLMAQSERMRCIKRYPAGSNDSALTLSASAGHAGVCELLLELRADCNAVNGDGDTPLTLAARAGHISSCRVFLASSPSTEVQTAALKAAESSCREDVVRLLRGYV